MKRRAASPTPSENEVDIFDSIFADNGDDGGGRGRTAAPEAGDMDVDNILNVNEADDDAEGDAAFIALQQAASFRKTTNLKGRSVKKGGGFQAMGQLNT
jgi:ATP-dependent RNA helicase DDX54/DBP10